MNKIVMCVAFDEEFCKDCFHGKPHFPVKVDTLCTHWEKCKQPLSLTGKSVLARCVDILENTEEDSEDE